MANYTSEQLAAVRKAIASGAMRVDFADRSVSYRRQEELLDLERRMMVDLGMVAEPGSTDRPRSSLVSFSRG
jgi:hypothetical protein